MTAEEWRPVANYSGYEVSDQGRVISQIRHARRMFRAAGIEAAA